MMKKALGKGLSALIPKESPAMKETMTVRSENSASNW